MREIAILAGRHLRSILRSRAARVLALLFLLGLLAAIWLPGGDARIGGTIVLAALLAVALLVFGVVAGIGNRLPEDRRMGRTEWILTTSPEPWKHRVAIVAAAWFLAVAVGGACGLAAGLTSNMWAPEFELHDARNLTVPPPHARQHAHVPVAPTTEEPGPAWTLPLPAERIHGKARLEIEIRPLYQRGRADFVDLSWTTDQGGGADLRASVWTPLQIELPAGASALTFRARDTLVGVRVRAARLLTEGPPPALGLIWAGLLLGIMAAAAAPIAVFVSRFTSGATASAAAFVLLIYGSVKAPLFEFLARVPGQKGATLHAMELLEGVSLAAPKLDLISVIGENAAGRALGSEVLAVLPPIFLYLLVGTLLVAAPMPARWAERKLG